jgi:hypothetical protein
MQLAAPQPRRHKVLMSFRYWNAWDVIFFDTDRIERSQPACQQTELVRQ